MHNENKRLFIALWPDGSLRQQIGDAAGEILRPGDGRPVARRNFHLTLAFLHHVPAATLPCIGDAVSACNMAPFDIVFDHFGFWRRSRLLWLGCSQPPPQLLALVGWLWESLASCGFTPERRPFHPHITLARRAAPPRRSLESPPIRWPVDRFALVESVTGGRQSQYNVLSVWPLSGRGSA